MSVIPVSRKAVVGGLILALAGFGFGDRSQAETPPPTPIMIGAASNILFAPVFVLGDQTNGIAARHGLKADVRIFASGIATMEAALAGDIDVAFPNSRVLLPLLASQKACFKAGLTFVEVNSVALVARADIKTPQQLIGRKVGTLHGGIGEVAMDMWLAHEGIDRSKVQYINVAEPDMPIALAQGSVDAIIWVEPTPQLALQIMGDKAHYLGRIGDAFRDVSPVNVTCSWYAKYGDKGMEALVAAWIDAVNYIRANPGPTQALVAKRLQLKVEDVQKIWQNGGWPEGWKADLSDSEFDMYNTYGKYLVDNHELTQMPDLSSWISSKWLRAVAPDRVKLTKYHY